MAQWKYWYVMHAQDFMLLGNQWWNFPYFHMSHSDWLDFNLQGC